MSSESEAKVAVVTGGGGGIGEAIVRRLLADGMSVAVVDVDEVACERLRLALPGEMQNRMRSFACDVSDGPSVESMAHSVLRDMGTVGVLVNCAALVAGIPRREFTDIPIDEWDRMMAVNVRGAFLCCRAFAHSLRTRSGAIVNVSSDMVLSGAPGLLHYVASKGALIALTRALASEMGTYGVTVNCIALGFTETDAVRHVDGEIKAERIAGRAIKRAGTPTDTAGVVSFLASHDAGFVTGQTIAVNGGYRFV